MVATRPSRRFHGRRASDSTGLRSPTIAVWGHYHGGNLGDEAVVSILIEAIRSRWPDARIAAISMVPEDAARRHGVRAYAINPHPRPASRARAATAPVAASDRSALRRVLRRAPLVRRLLAGARVARRALSEFPFAIASYRLLRGIDILVVAGSGQLLDAWNGPWQHPLTTFRWATLARLARTTLLLPSVGAGPIEGRSSAALVRAAVDGAAFVSVRDAYSARVLQGIGVERPLPVRPDMGWALAPLPDTGGPPPAGATPRVGVNVMAYEDPRLWAHGNLGRYEAYLERSAAFVARLLEQHEVVLFSSQTRSDRLVARDLLTRLAERGLAEHPRLESRLDAIEEVEDLVAVVAALDYVVAARFHSILLPLALGIPTLGLAYHPKTRELLEQIGRPSWCVDVESFDPEGLYDAVRRLRAEDGPAVRSALRARAAELRLLVERQFDELFEPRAAALVAGLGRATAGWAA